MIMLIESHPSFIKTNHKNEEKNFCMKAIAQAILSALLIRGNMVFTYHISAAYLIHFGEGF